MRRSARQSSALLTPTLLRSARRSPTLLFSLSSLLFLLPRSSASFVSFGPFPQQEFKALRWQVKYGSDRRPQNGTLVYADAFPLVFAGAGTVLPVPDVCDVRTWWPLTPAQTKAHSALALVTPFTVNYCGIVHATSAFLRNYRDAGFVGVRALKTHLERSVLCKVLNTSIPADIFFSLQCVGSVHAIYPAPNVKRNRFTPSFLLF